MLFLFSFLMAYSSMQGYSSRLAALDYTVCAHSEAFVTTQGGNFPHFLLGHRRYLYAGHSKTIQPDKRKLVLALDNPNIRSFLTSVLDFHMIHQDRVLSLLSR